MKNKTIIISVCLLVLSMSKTGMSDVVLDQNFKTNPDLSAWTKLIEPADTGTVTVTATAAEGLKIETFTTDRWRYQGVKYNEPFTLAGSGTLGEIIFDFYGTHDGSEYQRFNAPAWLLSGFDAATWGYFGTWNNNILLKGYDTSCEDYIQWRKDGVSHLIDPIAKSTNGIFSHVIFKVTPDKIKVYIENDFYENVAEPNCLGTVNTADVFTAGELQYGFFMYILSSEATSWYGVSSPSGNLFEGVKVTRIDPAAPASCFEIKELGYGLASDLNKDCKVDFKDFAIMAQGWLTCIDPEDSACAQAWQ